MKLTVATTALASSISVAAESLVEPSGISLHDVVHDSERRRHRNLAGAIDSQQEITSILKGRRGLRKEKGGILRGIQSKLKRKSLELRNQHSDVSDSGDAFDLGFFSRDLQANNSVVETNSTLIETNSTVKEPKEEKTIIEELLQLCDKGNPQIGLSCECTNVNETAYEIEVFCSYDETDCYVVTDHPCGTNQTFCYDYTSHLDLKSPGEGTQKICYDVSSPIQFVYCYELVYGGQRVAASACNFEFNGVQCNSCEFESDDCSTFDCTNIENAVGTGTTCGNDTLWREKVLDHLTYAPLPCEGGCNICPGNGEMTNLETIVSVPTGELYYCYQLNLAAKFGYLQLVPGDLCSALPSIVSEPCGCTGGVVDLGDISTDSNGSGKEAKPSSAAIFSGIGGLATTAVATSILSWMMA